MSSSHYQTSGAKSGVASITFVALRLTAFGFESSLERIGFFRCNYMGTFAGMVVCIG